MRAAPSRTCGDCSLCCKIMGVKQIDKPRNVWCRHCDVGVGCRIYEERPQTCRDYDCRYLIDPRLPEAWRPTTAKMVVNKDPTRVVIQVDPHRPDAWRREPYYSTIKQWARAARPGWPVFVCIGERTIAVYPDREKDVQMPPDAELGAA